jgi:hypothetical protein
VQSRSGNGGGGGEAESNTSFMTTVYTYGPGNTGGVAAQRLSGAGVPSDDPSDPTPEDLLLTNNVSASSKARAGFSSQTWRASLSQP